MMDEHDDITNVPPLSESADNAAEFSERLRHMLAEWNSDQAAKDVARSIGYGWSVFRPARKESFRFYFTCLNVTIITASIDYVAVQLELERIPSRIDLRDAHQRFMNAVIKSLPSTTVAESMSQTLANYASEPPEWSTLEVSERKSSDFSPPSMGLAQLFLHDIYGDNMSTFDKEREQKLIAHMCTHKYTQFTNALLVEFGGGIQHKKTDTLPLDKT